MALNGLNVRSARNGTIHSARRLNKIKSRGLGMKTESISVCSVVSLNKRRKRAVKYRLGPTRI